MKKILYFCHERILPAMIIITDSGSTKADWTLVDNNQGVAHIHTAGFNPYMQTIDDIVCTIKDSPVQKISSAGVSEIWFYGAGCTPGEKSRNVESALRQVFGRECRICVCSDMMGAARALCQDEEGIACILGTGSNSCLYDGREIVANVPPLGYILGDEGSGAHLGKMLVGNVLKGLMPKEITDRFFDEVGMTQADIIDKVYRRPMPNRWLASLAPFINRHSATEAVRAMVRDAFTAFFTRNVASYRRPDLPVNFVGSIAFFFKEILTETAARLDITIGKIRQSPMEGLTEYHGRDLKIEN